MKSENAAAVIILTAKTRSQALGRALMLDRVSGSKKSGTSFSQHTSGHEHKLRTVERN